MNQTRNPLTPPLIDRVAIVTFYLASVGFAAFIVAGEVIAAGAVAGWAFGLFNIG
jgi:hypothetical protein